jgi:hypothetical protein
MAQWIIGQERLTGNLFMPLIRWIVSAIMSLFIVVFVPMVIPDGSGGVLQPWQRILLDPVKAWKLEYYLDPYRLVFQKTVRVARDEGVIRVRVEKARDGSLAASNLPDASGKEVVLGDGNADLAAPTRSQGALVMAVCWLLVTGLSFLLLFRTPAHRRGKKGQGDFIAYTVESTIQRPLKDINDPEVDDLRSDLVADQVLNQQATGKMAAIDLERDKHRHLLD